MLNLQSALGVVALVGFAWLISENRRAVSPRRVLVGLAIALVLAVLFLKVPPVTRIFGSANHVIDAIYDCEPRRHRFRVRLYRRRRAAV